MIAKEEDCDLATSNRYEDDDNNIVTISSKGKVDELLLQHQDSDIGPHSVSDYVNIAFNEEALVNDGNGPPESIRPLDQNIRAGYVNVAAKQKIDRRKGAENARSADKMAGISAGSAHDIAKMTLTENSLNRPELPSGRKRSTKAIL